MKIEQALAELKEQVEALAALIEQGEPDVGGKVEEIRLLARIVAARGALTLAATLIDAHPHEVTGPVMDQIKALEAQVAAWREEGTGWFEERFITRDKVRMGKNPDTGEVEMWTEPRAYGPYYYYRWRDGKGKLRTAYYGRSDPRTEAPVVSDDITEAPQEGQEWAQGEEAASTLAEAGHTLQAAPEPVLKAVYSGSPAVQAKRKNWKAHLTADGELALCGLMLVDPSTSLVFGHDDCQRCRKTATKQGLVCEGCGEPLLRPAAPGLCYACAQVGEGWGVVCKNTTERRARLPSRSLFRFPGRKLVAALNHSMACQIATKLIGLGNMGGK